MSITEKLVALSNTIADLQKQLDAANAEYYALSTSVENNVYANLEFALAAMEKMMRNEAHEDCEGSYNCGAEKYTRDFKVDDVIYTATLKVEYNRHDKTYYYVDGATFSYKEKT